MQYNLSSLRQRILVDKLDDEDFDADVVDNFINDAQREIFNEFELPFQEKMFVGVVPVGSTMLQIPDDVATMQSQVMIGVHNFGSKQKDWRSFFRAFPEPDNETPGAPAAWTLYGDSILFSSPTDKEYTLKIFYISKPKRLVQDSDVPEVPEEFEELLLLGAFRRVMDRNEDYDLSGVIEQQYQKQLTQLVGRYGYRESDGPIKMKNRQR